MNILPFFVLLIINLNCWADSEFKILNILKLDPMFTPYVVVVEKGHHQLRLYKNENSIPKLIKTYPIATGKFKGDKATKGDRKTPEGIYTVQEFLKSSQLLTRYGDYGKIYGAGAFTLDYPNIIDQRNSKTGGGIWLHSTDDESRIDKGLDSRGCVVLNDENLKDISQYINLQKTPMIIVEDLYYLPIEKWQKQRQEIESVVNTWQKSWIEKDLETYINFYDQKRFDSFKGGYKNYKNYKKSVFSRADTPRINFEHISILVHNDYAIVQMLQDYKSDVIEDFGKKTLYLQKDEFYNWKITAELWSKVSRPEELAFSPSMRFFNEESDSALK